MGRDTLYITIAACSTETQCMDTFLYANIIVDLVPITNAPLSG